MSDVTIISRAPECNIELHHSDSDAGIWIVQRWRRTFLWFRKRVSSDWFIDGRQALAFAEELKREHESTKRLSLKA